MEQKINIAELLKDCPKGMELDCAIYNKVTLINVDDIEPTIFPIKVLRPDGCEIVLTEYGQYAYMDDAKCVIFPKGKTTWEGFVPPCKFKDGDILFVRAAYEWICIYKESENDEDLYKYVATRNNFYHTYTICSNQPLCFKGDISEIRLATEEEKQKFFQAIKDNGYHWNAETKTLEKLVEPKFKVGDKIKKFGNIFTIIQVKDNNYLTKCGNKIPIDNQDYFTLVPNKFDFTTLKPFDKVLVRVCDKSKWCGEFYMWYDDAEKDLPYNCYGGCWSQCVPFKSNEYLLGTTDDCDEYYKTW